MSRHTEDRGADGIKYVEAIRAKPGITTNELAAMFGVGRHAPAFALRLPALAPLVRMERASRVTPARWFPAESKKTHPNGLTIKPRREATMAADREVIVPPHVKVTVCPAGLDQRFTFTPPPGWTGQITRDWRERRLGAQR